MLHHRYASMGHAEGGPLWQKRQNPVQGICQSARGALQGLEASALLLVGLPQLLWQIAPVMQAVRGKGRNLSII